MLEVSHTAAVESCRGVVWEVRYHQRVTAEEHGHSRQKCSSGRKYTPRHARHGTVRCPRRSPDMPRCIHRYFPMQLRNRRHCQPAWGSCFQRCPCHTGLANRVLGRQRNRMNASSCSSWCPIPYRAMHDTTPEGLSVSCSLASRKLRKTARRAASDGEPVFRPSCLALYTFMMMWARASVRACSRPPACPALRAKTFVGAPRNCGSLGSLFQRCVFGVTHRSSIPSRPFG